MTIDRPDFTTTRLDEERAKDKFEVVGLKLSPTERAELEEIKELLDIQGDSQTLKFLARIGRQVVLTQFSRDDWRYLVSLKRQRYDGRKRRRI